MCPWGGVCPGVSARGVHTPRPLHAGIHTPREQTDTCENITLPEISFAGGNKPSFTLTFHTVFVSGTFDLFYIL